MNLDRFVPGLAGVMVLLGLALGHFLHPFWLFLPAFVGLNPLQASLTGFCPAAMVARKFGMKPGHAFR